MCIAFILFMMIVLVANYRDVFLEKSTQNFGDLYDYSETPEQFSYKDWVPIICPKHGRFEQKARTHVAGSGCPKCAHEIRERKQYSRNRHSKEQFIERSRKTHGTKYDYSKTIYRGQMKLVTITCPIHGEFEQIANNHIHGNGCSRCSDSRGERTIRLLLEEMCIEYQQQKTFPDCKNFNRTKPNVLPFDFYLPRHNILIEFDGKHHFEPVTFNGISADEAERLHKETVQNDAIKSAYAVDRGYVLVRIPYTEPDIRRTLHSMLD